MPVRTPPSAVHGLKVALLVVAIVIGLHILLSAPATTQASVKDGRSESPTGPAAPAAPSPGDVLSSLTPKDPSPLAVTPTTEHDQARQQQELYDYVFKSENEAQPPAHDHLDQFFVVQSSAPVPALEAYNASGDTHTSAMWASV
jgi:hypothetical protein